jgi:archaellum component FlaF (FlaF/FlaG flagellin family)
MTGDTAGTLTIQTGDGGLGGTTYSIIGDVGGNIGPSMSFAATNMRLVGDFSTSTFGARPSFMTSVTNGTTGVYAIPNGAATGASWQALNNADATNASKILIATNGSTDVQLVSGINGTGTYLPLTFYNNGSEKMRLDTSGNLLIGTSTSPAGSKELVLGGDYIEGVVAIGTVTSSSTISLANGTIQNATLTASTACTFTMPTAIAGKSFTLMLKQAAATGNGTATFTGVEWGNAGAPTVTATAGKMDILTFMSDGSKWYGAYNQGYTP